MNFKVKTGNLKETKFWATLSDISERGMCKEFFTEYRLTGCRKNICKASRLYFYWEPIEFSLIVGDHLLEYDTTVYIEQFFNLALNKGRFKCSGYAQSNAGC